MLPSKDSVKNQEIEEVISVPSMGEDWSKDRFDEGSGDLISPPLPQLKLFDENLLAERNKRKLPESLQL